MRGSPGRACGVLQGFFSVGDGSGGGPLVPVASLLVPATGLGLSKGPGPLGWLVWARQQDPLLSESDTS